MMPIIWNWYSRADDRIYHRIAHRCTWPSDCEWCYPPLMKMMTQYRRGYLRGWL